MPKPKVPAHTRRIEALAKKVAALAARGSRRRFLPPVSEAHIAAFEGAIGVRLPDVLRAFYREVVGGEQRTDVPAILTLEQSLTVAPMKPAEPFPFGDAQAQELMAKNQRKARKDPSAALPGPPHGALPVMDLGSGIDAVVLAGEQRAMVWQYWDAGWTPHFAVKKGQPVQLDFLAWVEEVFAEALATAPPPITADTRAVDLFYLGLVEAPPALRDARQLETLRLASNQIAALPAWLGELRSLKELRVGHNPLEALPASLAELPALELLDLSGTKLTAIPPWIGALRTLRRLLAARSQLEAVPDAIGELGELTHLHLQMNKLRALPEAIGELAELTELDVAKNALTQLPASLGRLARLRSLKIEHNPLRALPTELSALPLEAIDLEGLPELDWEGAFDVLAAMPRLGLLRVQQALPALPRALSRMQGLTTLRLIAVGLEELPAEVTALAAIQTLSLDQNRLTTLPDALGTMPSLETVVLFDNPIAKDEVARLRARWPHLKIEHG